MIAENQSEKISKTLQKIEEFRKNHSDMENELKRRLHVIKKKNIRTFLKQINAV